MKGVTKANTLDKFFFSCILTNRMYQSAHLSPWTRMWRHQFMSNIYATVHCGEVSYVIQGDRAGHCLVTGKMALMNIRTHADGIADTTGR